MPAIVTTLLLNAVPATAQTPPTTIDASRGGVTIASGVNSLTIGARLQFRWTLDDREDADADSTGLGAGESDSPISQFDVPRLRVSLSGGAFRPWLRYAVQFELSRTGGEGGSRIKDAILEVRPAVSSIRLQVGQFKVPFGLQQLTSSGRQQMVDRAVTDAMFAPGRDVGAMVAVTTPGRALGGEFGVFNGSGESVRQANGAHLWAGRVWFEPLGPYTLAEGAAPTAPKTVVHVGVGVRGGEPIRGRTPAGVVDRVDNQTAVNAEVAIRTGRIWATTEWFLMRDERKNPTPGPDVTSDGMHALGAFAVLPGRLDVGGLIAFVDADTAVSDSTVWEARAVAGYFFAGHTLKIQADAGRVFFDRHVGALPARVRQGLPALGPRLVSGVALADTQIRVQLQFAF